MERTDKTRATDDIAVRETIGSSKEMNMEEESISMEDRVVYSETG